MRIGVISDTHGLLRPEAVAALGGVSHIVHAGDIGAEAVVTALAALAPVTAVRGNVDLQPWASAYPETARIRLAGRAIYILHDRAELARAPAPPGTEVVVFGHSHRPLIERVGGVLHLNPGSAGPRRFRLPVTLGMLHLGPEAPRAEILDLRLE